RALLVQLCHHPQRHALFIERFFVCQQCSNQLVPFADRFLLVAMLEALPVLLSIDKHRPHDRAACACLVDAHAPAWFTDGLRPAPPGLPGHSSLRGWAMPWASVMGSYGGPGLSATRFRSPRRMRWRPLGLARRSGMRPSRTARRIVSSQTPFSRAASWMSISSSSWAAAAVRSFFRRASRAAAACSAPFSRSVSVSRCASRMKAASQGGRPLGSSRPSEPGILDAVLLPDPVARFGRHCPALFGDPEGDLLEILLAASLGVPGAKDLGAVPASTEAITDH